MGSILRNTVIIAPAAPVWGTEVPFYLSILRPDWSVGVCGQWAEGLPFQSLMTDLKDGSLSPLFQITSFDMLGHADNVLSENSFQGWMGYKLSTPRVGYFFNCSFIPLCREQKKKREDQKRDRQTPSKAGIMDCTRHRILMNQNSLTQPLAEAQACLFSSRREGTRWSLGVSLLTQTRKNAWTVCLFFCGLDCVFKGHFGQLHVMCLVSSDKLLCLLSVLQTWNQPAEHVALLCVSHKSFALTLHKNTAPVFNFFSKWLLLKVEATEAGACQALSDFGWRWCLEVWTRWKKMEEFGGIFFSLFCRFCEILNSENPFKWICSAVNSVYTNIKLPFLCLHNILCHIHVLKLQTFFCKIAF